MSLTDSRKMWKLLNEAGTEGQHSHDLRRLGISGNPSQRAKDITSKGFPIFTARESRSGRPGARYWLQEFAPDWSVPCQPNFGSAAASDEVSKGGEPVEGAACPPARLELVADYTGPEPKWYEREAA